MKHKLLHTLLFCASMLLATHGFAISKETTVTIATDTVVTIQKEPAIPNENYQIEVLKYQIRVAGLLEKANQNNDWIKIGNSVLFKEKYLDDEVGYYIKQYAFQNNLKQWFIDLDNIYNENYTFQNTYNKDKWSVVDPVVGGVIDITSLGLSFVGLDAIAESVGVIYFSARGDGVNAGLYAAALAIPVLSSGQLKLLKAATKNGILFYKGLKYSVKAGSTSLKQLASQSYKYGKVVDFFNLPDNAITPDRLDIFITRLKQGEINNSQIKAIINEPGESIRVAKFKSLSDEVVINGAGVLGSIVKTGNKVDYTNPAGKLLKWTEQGAGDIDNAIITAKNLDVINPANLGRITEAKVGEFVKQQKQLDGYALKIKRANNSTAGDIDVSTLDELIEVKKSFSAWSGKQNQVNKFVDSSLDDFLNPYNKKVILYIDEPLTTAQKNTIINYIPENVTLVNSLSELQTVLK